jgi:hypothetical protein
MTRRRGQVDPLLTSRQTQWLLVTVVGASVVSTSVLKSDADSRAFLDILDRHSAEGWILENELRSIRVAGRCRTFRRGVPEPDSTLCQRGGSQSLSRGRLRFGCQRGQLPARPPHGKTYTDVCDGLRQPRVQMISTEYHGFLATFQAE